MIRQQVPTCPIIGGFEPMHVTDMPAQHLAAKTAIEAYDVIALYRALDRDGRHQNLWRRQACAEPAKRAMHRQNQVGQLADLHPVMPDITAHDPCNQLGIDFVRGAFLRHMFHIPNFHWVYVVDSAQFTNTEENY